MNESSFAPVPPEKPTEKKKSSFLKRAKIALGIGAAVVATGIVHHELTKEPESGLDPDTLADLRRRDEAEARMSASESQTIPPSSEQVGPEEKNLLEGLKSLAVAVSDAQREFDKGFNSKAEAEDFCKRILNGLAVSASALMESFTLDDKVFEPKVSGKNMPQEWLRLMNLMGFLEKMYAAIYTRYGLDTASHTTLNGMTKRMLFREIKPYDTIPENPEK